MSTDQSNKEENLNEKNKITNQITEFESEMNNWNDLCQNIPYLATIPRQIRDDKKGKYCYPLEFQNKIYKTKDKFILFNETTYNEIPFGLVQLLSYLLSKINKSNESVDINSNFNALNNLSDVVSNCLDKYENIVKDQEGIIEQLEAISNAIVSMNDKINEHSNTFDNVQDILKGIDINKFIELKNQILTIINNYDNTNSQLGSSVNEIKSDIENIKLKINDLENSKIEKNENYETLNLNEYVTISMFTLFKENIEKQISKILNQINIDSNNINMKLSFEELSKLKEAGYSPEEICRLKILNLI